jgi:uncharacterized protein with PIN domain
MHGCGQTRHFLVDAMLGRLAKWLRILGYDTLYDPSWDDAQLVRLARAEDRILLTRDLELARRKGVLVLRVASESLEAQLDQLHAELGVVAFAPWTRCPVCNSYLLMVPKGDAWGQVPPYVFVTQEEFRLCPHCNRFYWRGTHRQQMQALVDRWGYPHCA